MKLIMVVLLVFGCIFEVEAQPYVIVNTDDQVITRNDIEDVFLMKTTSINAQHITVYIRRMTSVENELFLYDWLLISKATYKKRIDDLRSLKREVRLKEVNSDSEMILSVANTPNSIGYIEDMNIVNGRKNIIVYKLSH